MITKCKMSCLSKHGNLYYGIFRVLVGLMFFMHGAGKLFGWFGGSGTGFSGLMGVAGVVETLVGLAVLLGLWTRLAALGGAITMFIVYFYAHMGWNPLTSGGEKAVLYLVAFLILMRDGSGKWSLEKKLFGKEKF